MCVAISSRNRPRRTDARFPRLKSIAASSYLTRTLVGRVRSGAVDGPRSVAQVLERALADDPGREALVTRTRRLTYAQLDALANRAAHVLRDLGIEPGDRVAACLPNDADVVVAFHGAMRAGAVWVGVNQALAPPEKQYLLDDSGANVLLCEAASPDLSVRQVTLDEWSAAVGAAFDEPVGVEVD